MKEKEELQRAREELKNSIKVVSRNLKIFGKAVINEKKAVLKNIGNNIINTYKQLQSDIYIHKLNKEIAHYQKEREAAIKRAEALEEANRIARNRENTKALEEEARRVKRQERKERKLKFKNGIKQKTNSLKSRIGKVKNSFLKTLTTKNIDMKLREAFDRVEIFGLTAAGAGLAVANKGKDKITDFTSTQIAKLTEYRLKKQEEKQERERQESIRRAESLEEENIKSRTMDHKRGMIEALTAREREEYDTRHQENQVQKEILKQALLEQKNKLLNIQNEELESKLKTR